MINSLLYHEDIIKAINYDKETDLNDDDWSYLKEIVKVLKIFYDITMKMQKTSKSTVAECNFYFHDILVDLLEMKNQRINDYPYMIDDAIVKACDMAYKYR